MPKATVSKGGKARPVRYQQTDYPSVTAMARKRHISTAKCYELLRDGTAVYLDNFSIKDKNP